MKFINYNDVINKLVKCAYSNRKIDTCEDIISIINDIPVVNMDFVRTERVYFYDSGEKFRTLYEVIE